MKVAVMLSLIISSAITYANKAPQEVVDSLYALTNFWGQTGRIREYWSARKEAESKLNGYSDRNELYDNWYAFWINYLYQVPSLRPEWLREANGEIVMSSFSVKSQAGTNYWLGAANCLNRIIIKKNEAYEKWQRVDSKLINEFSTDNSLMDEWHETRNEYVGLNNSIGTLAWAVTNSFPATILPTLSAAEGAALYTNVLRRAGLVK